MADQPDDADLEAELEDAEDELASLVEDDDNDEDSLAALVAEVDNDELRDMLLRKRRGGRNPYEPGTRQHLLYQRLPKAYRGSGSRTPRPPGVIDRRIANVAQRVCKRNGWSYQDLADRIVPAHKNETWDKSRTQRFLNARKRVTITELADICRALEVTPEWFYQQAKVVTLPDSTRGWLEADVSISDEDRRHLLRQYQYAREAKTQADASGS